MTKWVTTTRRSSTAKVYHTSKDCRTLQHEPRKASDKEIENRGLELCGACLNGPGGKQPKQDRSYYNAATTADNRDVQCPYCGTYTGKLPNHLPCSESP